MNYKEVSNGQKLKNGLIFHCRSLNRKLHSATLCRCSLWAMVLQDATRWYFITSCVTFQKYHHHVMPAPVRGVILKYFGVNHTLCVKFEPNWTRRIQLEEGIKSLACGSWFYPFLSLFANSFNLVRYSSRGGQEKPLGWRLRVFLDQHSMNILMNTPGNN